MSQDRIPTEDSPSTEKMLFLQENMVHLVNQMSMPVIEVSLVLSKYLNRMVGELENKAAISDAKGDRVSIVCNNSPRMKCSYQTAATPPVILGSITIDNSPFGRILMNGAL